MAKKHFKYLYDNFYKVKDDDITKETLNYLNKHRGSIYNELRFDNSEIAVSTEREIEMARNYMSSPDLDAVQRNYRELYSIFNEIKFEKDNITDVKNTLSYFQTHFDKKDISTLDKNGKQVDLKENMLYNVEPCLYMLVNSPNKNFSYHDLEIAKNSLEKSLYGQKDPIIKALDNTMKEYKKAVKDLDKGNEKLIEKNMINLNESYYQLYQTIKNNFKTDFLWNSEVERQREEDHIVYLYTNKETDKKVLNKQLNSIKELYSKPKEFEYIRDLSQRETLNKKLKNFPDKIKQKEHKQYIKELEKFVKSQKDNNRTIIVENEMVKDESGFKILCNKYMASLKEGNLKEANDWKIEIIIGAEYLINEDKEKERKAKEPLIDKKPFEELLESINQASDKTKEEKEDIWEKAFNKFKESVPFEVVNRDWNKTCEEAELQKLDASGYLKEIENKCNEAITFKDNDGIRQVQKEICANIKIFQETYLREERDFFRQIDNMINYR